MVVRVDRSWQKRAARKIEHLVAGLRHRSALAARDNLPLGHSQRKIGRAHAVDQRDFGAKNGAQCCAAATIVAKGSGPGSSSASVAAPARSVICTLETTTLWLVEIHAPVESLTEAVQWACDHAT